MPYNNGSKHAKKSNTKKKIRVVTFITLCKYGQSVYYIYIFELCCQFVSKKKDHKNCYNV